MHTYSLSHVQVSYMNAPVNTKNIHISYLRQKQNENLSKCNWIISVYYLVLSKLQSDQDFRRYAATA